jgi:hypothetical protein
MQLRRKPVEAEILEGWQLTSQADLRSAPSWVAALQPRIDKDPDQTDRTRDARAVLRDGRSTIMLYIGHWLVKHPDGMLEPMTDVRVQAQFEPVPLAMRSIRLTFTVPFGRVAAAMASGARSPSSRTARTNVPRVRSLQPGCTLRQ